MDQLVEPDNSENQEERPPEPTEEPLFGGVREVIALIRYLYERPGLGDRPRTLDLNNGWQDLEDRRERTHRKGLPMVCLVRPDGPDELLGALATRLASALPTPIPHAFDRLAELTGPSTSDGQLGPLTVADVRAVRDRLRTLANLLAHSKNAKTGRFRFRLFSLAYWLMDQKLAEDSLGQERELLARLRAKDPIARVKNILDDASANLPDAPAGLPWLVAVLRWVPLAIFRGKVTGRVPLLSGPYRWFLRQPNLNPELPGGFVGFAERLTAGQWDKKENPEQVARLLTNAFLEDLRRAYRWRPWKLSRRRRTTYVVVLLDNITRANGGYALLRLINDVRNAVGRFDPLLVVSASRKVPPYAARDASRPIHGAENAGAAYQAWQDSLVADRRAHRDTAWYLPLRIPGPPSDDARDDLRQKMDLIRPYRVPRAAWWSRRALRVGLVIVVLAGLLTGYYEWSASHCGGGIHWPGLRPSLVWADSECIGVTDGSDNIFQPSDDTVAQVLTVIKSQNDQARQRHLEQPQRPYITVAVVEAFTSATTSQSGGLTSERESLEGAAVAQANQLNASGDADPIVRLLIVNAGRGMGRGQQVAQQLGVLAAQDPSVVGVVGLDQTRQPTVDTINALANAGLPSVGAALSADSLTVNHPMYFQIAPQNTREAAVAAAFAGQLRAARSVRVYYSDDAADVYSRNLRDDVMQAFHNRGFQTRAVAFTPSPAPEAAAAEAGDDVIGNAAAAGRDTCSVNGLVYFAGRGLPDFADFLSGAKQCGSQAPVIADDDVTRYVADAQVREQNRALPFYYQSFALAPNTALQGPAAEFYSQLDNRFTFETGRTTGRSFDGYAALTFDATRTFITAAEYLRESNGHIPVTPGSVWREITAIHNSRSGPPDNAIVGATGQIDFGGDITRHVPLDKPVAILRVAGGEVQDEPVGLCGTDVSFHPQSSWCPPLVGSR